MDNFGKLCVKPQTLLSIKYSALILSYDYLKGRNVCERIKDCELKIRKIVNCGLKKRLRIYLGFLDYYFTVFACTHILDKSKNEEKKIGNGYFCQELRKTSMRI